MKEIIIDSFLRTNGTNENFNVLIPYCTEVKLLEAYIPMSYFNVHAGPIAITGTNTGVSVINVPAGRYTQKMMATFLQSQLTTMKPGENYTVGVDLVNRFTIAANETFVADFTLFAYLGFTGVQPLANNIVGSSTTTVFQIPYILIKSSNIMGTDNGPILEGQSGGILHVVPTCCGEALDYRTSAETPWFKVITRSWSPIINMNFAIQVENFTFNGARWVIKILIR